MKTFQFNSGQTINLNSLPRQKEFEYSEKIKRNQKRKEQKRELLEYIENFDKKKLSGLVKVSFNDFENPVVEKTSMGEILKDLVVDINLYNRVDSFYNVMAGSKKGSYLGNLIKGIKNFDKREIKIYKFI
ncbi:MAG: hypothetical protein PVJ67_07105 [Candidatus Pacearchaeota archaeon]|jgi:hypothetical protein